jgi:AcrR family transcriptional regulator
MAAVQQAAVELLAERGPREVTVRAVAERADVNHALVHRHFGTKDDLIRAVIAQQSQEIGAQAARLARSDVAGMLGVLRDHPAYWRVLARTILDAPEMLTGGPLPAAAMVLGRMTADAEASGTTRERAAVAGSLALGWLVFGAHLASVLQIDDVEAFDAAVAAHVRTVTEG